MPSTTIGGSGSTTIGGSGSTLIVPTQIAWLTDLHYGRASSTDPTPIFTHIGATYPSASRAIASGDLTDHARLSEMSSFAAAVAILAAWTVYEIAGNHDEIEDDPDASGDTANGPADWAQFNASGFAHRFSFTAGNFYFIGFKTFILREPDPLHGKFDLPAGEITFIEDELILAETAGKIPVLVAHPPIATSLGNNIGGTPQTTLLALMAKYNCRAFLSGHRHLAFSLATQGDVTNVNGHCVSYSIAGGVGHTEGGFHVIFIANYDLTFNVYSATSPFGLFATENLSFNSDRTRPTVVSKTVSTDGLTLTKVFSESVSYGAGGSGGGALTASGGAVTETYSSGTGTATHVFTLSRAIEQDETITSAFTPPGDGAKDAAGNKMVAFSGATVDNDSTYTIPPYASSVLDGNDRITRGADLTGNTDGKTGLLSFWFKAAAATGGHVLGCTNQRFIAYIATTLNVDASNAAGTLIMRIRANSDLRNDAWHHFMASWDLSDIAKRHIYVDGADAFTAVTYTNDTIDYTQAEYAIGSRGDAFGQFTGKLTEVYFAREYLDLSVSGNRLKFRTAGGAPENLGANGSTPTGTQPIIFTLHNQVPNAHTNLGSGGGFTQQGVLVDGGADKP